MNILALNYLNKRMDSNQIVSLQHDTNSIPRITINPKSCKATCASGSNLSNICIKCKIYVQDGDFRSGSFTRFKVQKSNLNQVHLTKNNPV